MKMQAGNTSVLVIDDEEMIRDNIQEILSPKKIQHSESLDLAASLLFDEPKGCLSDRASNIPEFRVDKASNGMEGVEMVKKSVADGTPYAVIFLDMRMPGWDGMETAEQIRRYDSKAEIIFVTAYSDRGIDEIISRAGENVGYHCKPYASEEITQLATKAAADYNKLRNLEQLIECISSIGLDEYQLNALLRNILDQLITFVDTDLALLGRLHEDDHYETIFDIGDAGSKIDLGALIGRVRAAEIEEGCVLQQEEIVISRLEGYCIFAVLKKNERLKTEKLYLLRLYVLNAAKAIRNAELRARLLQKEKLSAIGKAMGMLIHDLRSPIKNIPVLTSMLRAENIKSDWLDLIDSCGAQASAIFEDFMDFINETPARRLQLDLGKLVGSVAITVPSGWIKYDIPVGLQVNGDESKLRRALSNLVNNAVEVLKYKKVADPAVCISARCGDEWVEIVIRDNGPGIPGDILRTVFEPFVTKDKANGTGLGLAIVKQYVAAHGGDIKAHNDGGAVFTIRLPVAG